jgi:hypothetical protein
MKSRSIECGFLGEADTLIRDGPTILVDVGFDPSWRTEKLPQRPKLAAHRIRALIDTGADLSYVDCDLATRLKLPIVDRARPRVLSGSGLYEPDVYLAQIFIAPLLFVCAGEFPGVYLKRYGEPYEVQIGRTFLANCTLSYDGRSGRVTLTRMH